MPEESEGASGDPGRAWEGSGGLGVLRGSQEVPKGFGGGGFRGSRAHLKSGRLSCSFFRALLRVM